MIFFYKIFKITTFSDEEINWWLHQQEILYVNKLNKHDKNHFLNSRINLKTLLTKYPVFVKPATINTTKNLNYLYLKNQKIYFSISYSRDFGICVIGQEVVGVDLEFLKQREFDLKKITSQAGLGIC